MGSKSMRAPEKNLLIHKAQGQAEYLRFLKSMHLYKRGEAFENDEYS
jgi:hypothetical protein